ncbi:hypothetical protein MMC18_009039 [Xylographa bjoerkii]|nr:hypothetical protein [Xylographa bjoerkii]
MDTIQSLVAWPRPLSRFTILYSILACLLYVIGLLLYRLVLSPIAKFPGSKIAATTGWYETYLDVFKGGQFTFQIEQWHKQYGPIIRINPWEIHIANPEFHEILYSTKSRYNKIEALKYRFGLPLSSFDTIDHDHHHRRRGAIALHFSRQKVIDFSPYIQSLADKLSKRLTVEYGGTLKVVNLNEAYAAFVSDAITYYTFAFSYNFLDYPDFVTPFTTSIRKLALSLHMAGHFPWLLKLLQTLPDTALATLNPMMKPVFDFHNVSATSPWNNELIFFPPSACADQVQEVKNQILKIMSGENDGYRNVNHRTVFNELLQSNLPPEELSVERLKHEAASITGAGIDTTKTTLSLASFHILSNQHILQRLREELAIAIPDPSASMPTVPEMEKLPYLNAIVQESLRMSYGISQRLSRINPHGPIQYGSYTIPPNVPFSMTSYLMHRDESIFPDPDSFKPERWLNDPKAPSGKPLTKYLVAFGRGPRMCLGMNFANAELFIGLATVFRRLDLELFETERDAVDMAADFFVPIPKPETKGVRVIVK